MTTFQWSAQDGSLMTRQTGVTDLASLFSASYAVWGSIGGLDGVRAFLNALPNSFGRNQLQLNLENDLKLVPKKFHIFTGNGHFIYSKDNAEDAFGGDRRTQLIGLTICALAHEIHSATATRLFLKTVSPIMLGGNEAAVSALSMQLMDDARIQQIINEGHILDLSTKFFEAVERASIPYAGDSEWTSRHFFVDDDVELPEEIHMVGGLLRWLVSDDKNVYPTRSALVARIALYLKEVGYSIGKITSWNGDGLCPRTPGGKAVLLVLGGTSKTDRLMLDPRDFYVGSRILHYQFHTVGAMLLTALEHAPSLLPEVLQEQFRGVWVYMQKQLRFEYQPFEDGLLEVHIEASKSPTPVNSIAVSLAALYFPASANFFAPCYKHIAHPQVLTIIRESINISLGEQEVPEEVANFRALTASIIISFFGALAAPDFEQVKHKTILMLWTPIWLENMCFVMDNAVKHHLRYHTAVAALAILHAAQPYDEALDCNERTIAWRNGTQSVLPNLILNLQPTADAARLRLIDQFWANVTPQQSGCIVSGGTPNVSCDDGIDSAPYHENVEAKPISHIIGEPYIGEPQYKPTDVPLYVSFERPLHNGSLALSLVGRINGVPVGSAGISDVLYGLLRSNIYHQQQYQKRQERSRFIKQGEERKSSCSHYRDITMPLIVSPSRWAQIENTKPVSSIRPTFVPVQGDVAWAIFLIGNTNYLNGIIVWDCIKCVIETLEQESPRGTDVWGVLIGLGSDGASGEEITPSRKLISS